MFTGIKCGIQAWFPNCDLYRVRNKQYLLFYSTWRVYGTYGNVALCFNIQYIYVVWTVFMKYFYLEDSTIWRLNID
jgi:hypothetical protein